MPTLTAEIQPTEPPRVQIVATDFPGESSIVINGGFEDGMTGWTGPATADDGAATIAPAEGSLLASAALAGTTRTIVAEQIADASPGPVDVTALGAAMVGDDGAGTVELEVVATTAGAPTGDAVTDVVDATDAWQDLAASVAVPDGADGIRIRLYATPGTAPLTVMFDDVTAHTTGAGTVTLYRVAAEHGDRVPVRGVIDITPTGGAIVAVDYGAPFNTDVYYVMTQTFDDGTTAETISNTVVLVEETSWISNPITGQGVALTIVEWTEYNYPARQSVIGISGRPAPIVVSDVRSTATSEITVYTPTRSKLRALREVLAVGDILQIRPVCDAVEDTFAAIGDVTEERFTPTGVTAGSDWRRTISMALHHVAQPTPEIPAVGDTLADLADYVPTTLADMAVAFGPDATLLTIAATDLSVAVI